MLHSWPQYSGRLLADAQGRSAIHVPVFQYFVFWTAFYMLRGPQSDSGSFQQPNQGSHRSYTAALGPSLGSVTRVSLSCFFTSLHAHNDTTWHEVPLLQSWDIECIFAGFRPDDDTLRSA